MELLKKVLRPRWPRPKFDEAIQPHFLFIVTPPYAGSTALCKLIGTSPRTMLLHETGEGQWLVPGLCEADRWDEAKTVDYASVKAVWLNKYQRVKRRAEQLDVVIEKAPKYMMRLESLAAQFADVSFLANNRNPYASCASVLYRNHDAEQLSSDERNRLLRILMGRWVVRSRRVMELVQKLHIPLTMYETWCENPTVLLSSLHLPEGLAATIRPHAEIAVKDYAPRPVRNHNERQIGRLRGNEIRSMSGVLQGNESVMEFFGYRLMDE